MTDSSQHDGFCTFHDLLISSYQGNTILWMSTLSPQWWTAPDSIRDSGDSKDQITDHFEDLLLRIIFTHVLDTSLTNTFIDAKCISVTIMRGSPEKKTQPIDIITGADVITVRKELILQVRTAVPFRLSCCSYKIPILHTFWQWIVDQWVWTIRWKMCFSVFIGFEEDRLQLNEVNFLTSRDVHEGLLSKTIFVSSLLKEELTGLSNVTTESGFWLVVSVILRNILVYLVWGWLVWAV